MIRLIITVLRKFPHALRGIYIAGKSELNFQIELAGVPILALYLYWLWPLQSVETVALTFSYALILVLELINTSLEAALDQLHPERHATIQNSKDITAGAVLVAVLLFFATALLVYINHFPTTS